MPTTLLALLDDITAMTKLAASKTAGVLGDDLAVNAEQVSGVKPERELPVVWAVAKGSIINKTILVPAALLISAFAPWALTPLLMLGGLYLCYEGAEKIFHTLIHHLPGQEEKAKEEAVKQAIFEHALQDSSQDLVVIEKSKIKGAIRTDFVLSAEIIVISLGTMVTAPIITQIAALSVIAVLMTVGVYGLVAGIVKLDDLGMHLSYKKAPWNKLGRVILRMAPWLMTTLTVVGTAAMFLVGGGILAHGIPLITHHLETWSQTTMAPFLALIALHGVLGMIAGAMAVASISGFLALKSTRKP